MAFTTHFTSISMYLSFMPFQILLSFMSMLVHFCLTTTDDGQVLDHVSIWTCAVVQAVYSSSISPTLLHHILSALGLRNCRKPCIWRLAHRPKTTDPCPAGRRFSPHPSTNLAVVGLYWGELFKASPLKYHFNILYKYHFYITVNTVMLKDVLIHQVKVIMVHKGKSTQQFCQKNIQPFRFNLWKYVNAV